MQDGTPKSLLTPVRQNNWDTFNTLPLFCLAEDMTHAIPRRVVFLTDGDRIPRAKRLKVPWDDGSQCYRSCLSETDPQMLEHWGCADEDHLGKLFHAMDFGLECQHDVPRLQCELFRKIDEDFGGSMS